MCKTDMTCSFLGFRLEHLKINVCTCVWGGTRPAPERIKPLFWWPSCVYPVCPPRVSSKSSDHFFGSQLTMNNHTVSVWNHFLTQWPFFNLRLLIVITGKEQIGLSEVKRWNSCLEHVSCPRQSSTAATAAGLAPPRFQNFPQPLPYADC